MTDFFDPFDDSEHRKRSTPPGFELPRYEPPGAWGRGPRVFLVVAMLTALGVALWAMARDVF